MSEDPLSPARGVIIGVILGAALWVLAIWIAKAIAAATIGSVVEVLR